MASRPHKPHPQPLQIDQDEVYATTYIDLMEENLDKEDARIWESIRQIKKALTELLEIEHLNERRVTLIENEVTTMKADVRELIQAMELQKLK